MTPEERAEWLMETFEDEGGILDGISDDLSAAGEQGMKKNLAAAIRNAMAEACEALEEQHEKQMQELRDTLRTNCR